MSYWTGCGKHQAAYDRLWARLVPAAGSAPTPHGELLRVVSRVYYAFYNDGDTHVFGLVDNARCTPRELAWGAARAPPAAARLLEGLRADLGAAPDYYGCDDVDLDDVVAGLFHLDEAALEAAMDAAVEHALSMS